MNSLYAMQRANGDWFALDDRGRFRVPLFHSSSAAMVARSCHSGMLLFKPVLLDARLLKEIVPPGTVADVDFWLVNDPFTSLRHGHLAEHAQLKLLMQDPVQLQTVGRNPNTLRVPILDTVTQSDRKQT